MAEPRLKVAGPERGHRKFMVIYLAVLWFKWIMITLLQYTITVHVLLTS
jgi:hypothetical protein